MSDPDKLYEVCLSISKDMGEIKGTIIGLTGHISAIGTKAEGIRKDLAEHKEDDGAHGVKGQRDGGNWFLAKIGLLFAALELLLHGKELIK